MKKKNQTTKQRAFYYYSLGLNSKEIAKLLDVSPRTIQGYAYRGNWKNKINPTPLKQRVFELHRKGISQPQIAKLLNVSRTTIYLWLKEVKQANEIK